MGNISEHFKKEYWKRRVAPDADIKPPTNSEHYIQPTEVGEERFQLLTQSDFLKEIEPSAHDINGRFQSTRPIKECVEKTIQVPATRPDGTPIFNEDGTPKMTVKKIREWVIVDYDKMETARLGYQRRFALTKAAHGAGDGFSINNEQIDKSKEAHERFDNLNSWKDIVGLDMALMEVYLSCYQTGDAGVYLYVNPCGEIEYKVYSFLDGYEIFPDIDERGNDIYYILYSIKGQPACDIHSTEFFETWVKADLTEGDDNTGNTWWDKVKGLFSVKDNIVSEDGWRRVSHQSRQIGSGIGQFAYFRVRDIPSGVSQMDIAALERVDSFVLEGVKSTTFDTLFIKATNVESLPPIGSHGSVLAVKGDSESLKASDAKRLAPSDVSNVATIAQKELKESILHSTMSVIVDPDILRSGADSSSAMRLCFNDEVKYAMVMQPLFFKPLKHMVNVFKNLVAKVTGDSKYASMRVSITQNIWVPSNFSEAVENVTKMKYAGIISAENSRHELDVNYPDDMDIISKEEEDKLYRSAFVPLRAKYDAAQKFGPMDVAEEIVVTEDSNPKEKEIEKKSRPGVTNQATNK